MTDVIKFLTFKHWLGGADERFKYTDMNRIRYNTKAMADFFGLTYNPTTVQHKDVFNYQEQNALESMIYQICRRVDLDPAMETNWNYNRSVSYKDFNRIEYWLWLAYGECHGEGQSIGWDEERLFDPYTLYADNWTGTGPYYYDMPTDLGSEYDEGLIWVSPTATVLQRAEEYNAMITVVSSTSGVRLCANGIKPKLDIPVVITRGRPMARETATLTSSGWAGTGPWTQNVVFSQSVSNGVLTINENATSAQASEFAKAGLSVSAVSGSTVTIRAVMSKPTVNLPVMLIFEPSEAI